MSKKFCVSITQSKENEDRVTVGFVVAGAALGSEMETLVFLSADGVWAAVRSEYGKIDVGAPFAPLNELVDKFVAAGGRIMVCAPCMKKRSIEAEHLIAGASPAGGAALVEFLADGVPCISY